jgi:aminoglycoside phosphotransferase (APT) family kinase protein
MPKAEIDVTSELVRSLLAAQLPELADLPITLLANGWDNALFRAGPDHVVRLPRREVSVALVDHEAQWLPRLAPRLPVRVPSPVHVGEPTDLYPWRWTVVPWFEGIAIGTTPLVEPARVARSLGSFLAALHKPAPPDHPLNPFRGGPLAGRDEITRERLAALDHLPELQHKVAAAWEVALAASPWDRGPMWIHGDLHPANIVVHDDDVAAVIDFGDITGGDPATDLLVAWALFDAANRSILRDAADTNDRPVDDAMWARGRGWGVAHGLAVVSGSADNAHMNAIGMRTLEIVAAN